eukprot:SAG31_NODE_4308_length_3369_cov_2.531804_5_plen_54_part_01
MHDIVTESLYQQYSYGRTFSTGTAVLEYPILHIIGLYTGYTLCTCRYLVMNESN